MEHHVPPTVLRRIPNVLTTLRLLAVPVFAVLVLAADGETSPAAAAVFAFAALTDFLDGELSRRLHAQSRYGRVLDPIADRLLIDVAVVLLWFEGRVPLVLVAIVLLRDAILLFSLLLGRGRDLGIRVNVVGKAGTLVTMIGLLLAMLTPRGSITTQIVLWSGVVLLLLGGLIYARTLRRLRARG